MEIDHLLSTTDTGQLQVYDKDSLKQKVSFWLDTPKGQCWGNAKWGHRLLQFKHEPQSNSITEVAIENSILFDLPDDIPAIDIKGIRVSFIEQDKINIAIDTNIGEISHKLLWSES